MPEDDEVPTSFDALAHEHNLSGPRLDMARIFFRAGVVIGRRQQRGSEEFKARGAVLSRHETPAGNIPTGREYHPALDRETAPGEFR